MDLLSDTCTQMLGYSRTQLIVVALSGIFLALYDFRAVFISTCCTSKLLCFFCVNQGLLRLDVVCPARLTLGQNISCDRGPPEQKQPTPLLPGLYPTYLLHNSPE